MKRDLDKTDTSLFPECFKKHPACVDERDFKTFKKDSILILPQNLLKSFPNRPKYIHEKKMVL
jgi:hypothetical protein